MSSLFQPPPTWAEVILVDQKTKKAVFNPIWLKWFVDLVSIIDASGGGGGTISHNSTAGLQGGTANQFYHLTNTEHTGVQSLVARTFAIGPTTLASGAQAGRLYMGTGVPSNAAGNNGDFFLRTDGTQAGNSVVYHKEAGAWVALITT